MELSSSHVAGRLLPVGEVLPSNETAVELPPPGMAVFPPSCEAAGALFPRYLFPYAKYFFLFILSAFNIEPV